MHVVKATFGAETRYLTPTFQWRSARALAREFRTESGAKLAARVAPLQGWAVEIVPAGKSAEAAQ
jgi:hypothetical protein